MTRTTGRLEVVCFWSTDEGIINCLQRTEKGHRILNEACAKSIGLGNSGREKGMISSTEVSKCVWISNFSGMTGILGHKGERLGTCVRKRKLEPNCTGH